MAESLTPERLAAIADRAAHAYEYDPSEQAQVLAGADVPALLAEVERLRAERDEAREQCTEMERQGRFFKEEALGRIANLYRRLRAAEAGESK